MSKKWKHLSSEFKQEVADYYSTHTFSSTLSAFKMPDYVLHQIIEELQLPLRTRSEALRIAREQSFGSIEKYKEAVKTKIRETSLRKYGVDNFAKTADFQAQTKKTCQERYGVDNPMQSDAVKETYKQSCLNHLGVEWPMMNSEVLQKRTSTNEQKYGGNGLESNTIRDSYITTIQDRYGVDNVAKSDDIKAKISQTIQERYGVKWFCMTPQARKYSRNNSKPNTAFQELLERNNIDFTREFTIEHFSYDFKVGNILLEVNPTPTHNSTWGLFKAEDAKGCDYHINKSKLAEKNGYRCIHIWDWDDIDKIVRLLKPRERVYARKCSVKTISSIESKEFLQTHHLQGNVRATVHCGLFYDNKLISVMTFGKPRYTTKFEYELLRYASISHVVGGAEKLFSYFCSQYHPSSIVSYCDNSKFLGIVYEKLGFKFVSRSPSKHWYSMSLQKHITDNLLRQRGFDQLLGSIYGTFGKGTSNEQLMLDHGFVELYDAGQSTYVWHAS